MDRVWSLQDLWTWEILLLTHDSNNENKIPYNYAKYSATYELSREQHICPIIDEPSEDIKIIHN